MKKNKMLLNILFAVFLTGCSSTDLNANNNPNMNTNNNTDTNTHSDYSINCDCIFKNYDMSILYSTNVSKGSNVNYYGPTPTRPSDSNYTYSFTGWDKPLYNIQNNTTFVAQYSRTEIKSSTSFTVTWKNYDGTILEVDKNVELFTVPHYDGPTPTRPSDSNYAYTFKGWDQEPNYIYSDTTYTATFSFNSSPVYDWNDVFHWNKKTLDKEPHSYDYTIEEGWDNNNQHFKHFVFKCSVCGHIVREDYDIFNGEASNGCGTITSVSPIASTTLIIPKTINNFPIKCLGIFSSWYSFTYGEDVSDFVVDYNILSKNTHLKQIFLPDTLEYLFQDFSDFNDGLIMNIPSSLKNCPGCLSRVDSFKKTPSIDQFNELSPFALADLSFDTLEIGLNIKKYRSNCFSNIKSGSIILPINDYLYNIVAEDSTTKINIIVKEGVTKIPEGYFNRQEHLDTVTLPSTCKIIGKRGFEYADVQNVVLNCNEVEIEDDAFRYSSLLSINFDKVISIGNRAFLYSRLGTVVLDKNIKSVGTNAFSDLKKIGNSGTIITISAEINYIDGYAFSNCEEISVFTIKDFYSGNSKMENWNSDWAGRINCLISKI